MNIEQAKAIPMSEFLKKLNVLPYRDYPDSALYKAPHRTEKTASFRVSKVKNVWYDHGTGKGGTLFDFVIEYLKSQKEDYTPSDALRFINKIWDGQALQSFNAKIAEQEKEEYKLSLKSISELTYPVLIKYLKERGITEQLAKLNFKQAELLNSNTGKTFSAIAFKNESEGYELRNRLFKGCVNAKDISFIRGTKEQQSTINVFEGMLDYVSVLALLKVNKLPDDVIVLNSLSCLSKAFPFLTSDTYNYVYSWLDNDVAGESHRQILDDFIKAQDGIKHVSLHPKYAAHKDVNAWLMSQMNLSLAQ